MRPAGGARTFNLRPQGILQTEDRLGGRRPVPQAPEQNASHERAPSDKTVPTMKPASLFRSLFALLLVAAVSVAVAAPDSYTGPAPVPYKGTAHFSKRYDPSLKPDRPAYLFRPAPIIYPKQWRAWGQPAYAVVEFLIADTGFPKEVQCTEATDRAFAKAAIKAIEDSRFDPALKNQQGVYSKLTLRLSFTVNPPVPAQPAAPAAPAEQAPAAK